VSLESVGPEPQPRPQPLAVLLVEDDPTMRAVLRFGLEPDGVSLLEAENLAQARVVLDEPFEAVILDRHLPDGLADELIPELRERLPDSRIIIHSVDEPIAGLPAVGKCDITALAELLALYADRGTAQVAVEARRAVGRVHREWIELCRWDPSLPPDTRPPVAEVVIKAINDALERPQPIGWGLDPALQPTASVFGLNAGDVRLAVAELVCLKEAFARVVIAGLGEGRTDALRRLDMIIDRIIVEVVESGLERLAHQAFSDELTGLGNRWAFEQDLEKEISRSSRSHSPLSVAVIDLDHLKQTNDTEGHPAGDRLLRKTSYALRTALRHSDRAYRIGGDEFAIILVDTADADSHELVDRLLAAGSAPISLGMASWPPDDLHTLVQTADERLYEGRRHRRRAAAAEAPDAPVRDRVT
jgi:diguanylate cyclase (GGDEF)-like protein